jgi:hypothetical protein
VQEGNTCEVCIQYSRKLAGYVMKPPEGAPPCDEGGCKEISVAEVHHFYAALALGKNFVMAPAALVAPAPTLLYSKAKFLKRT